MRQMSFSLTTPQMRARGKTVTRRLGWWKLRAGDVVMAIEKGQGLKKGEKVKRIGPIHVVSTRAERLDAIDAADAWREGFPPDAAKFIAMFCAAHRCNPETLVNRIEFRFV